jgi:anti-sigma factor RsiW
MSNSETIRCRQLVELATDYLEGMLPPDRHAQVEAHLGRCDCCARYVAQMRETLDVVGHLEPGDLDPRVEQALLHAFREWKAGEA